MIWFVIAAAVAFVLYKFFSALAQDKQDLKGTSVQEKFGVIAQCINNAAFQGRGKVTVTASDEFNIYQDGKNQIIKFAYSTGSLTIQWKYKFFQKEVVHEKVFPNVRNLSLFEQENIANRMIDETSRVIYAHQQSVLNP